MESVVIHGLSPRPDTLYRAGREQAEHRARDYTAVSNPQPCHYCKSGLYTAVPSPCPACGQHARNGYVLGQRSQHTRPCPGCQMPSNTAGLCSWCQHWENVEARALAQAHSGVITERQVSRVGQSQAV
jgi:hypothetical protein